MRKPWSSYSGYGIAFLGLATGLSLALYPSLGYVLLIFFSVAFAVGFYFIRRDIDESLRTSQKLQQAETALAHLSRVNTMGELAASIAHEVKQPIAAVVTNGSAGLRWLAQQPPNVAGAEESLRGIVRDANRAAEVIGRLRSLLTKTPIARVSLDINLLICEVVELATFQFSTQGTVMTLELSGDVPSISGDRVQLQQVLLNLILNSLNAMNTITDRPRRLQIRSFEQRDNVVVQVEDSGRGLNEEDLAHMFDAFYTTRKDGIGMGLAISRSIIESHGGRIWAEPGKPHGAVLTFTIPVARPA